MWPPSQSPIGWILIGIIIIIFFFLTFGSKTTDISFFGHLPWTLNASPNNTDHHSYFFLIFPLFYACFSSRNANVSIFGNAHWTLKTVPSQHHHQSIPVFFWFFLYFIAIFHPEKHFFLYLEVHTGPWNSTHPSPVMTAILIFFVIFSPFYWYFSCSIAALSIFGNVRWTLKTMPNMVTNHPPFFPLFFSYFVAILLLFFIQHSHTFHIWKCAFDPEYNAQHGHQPSSIFFHFFPDFFRYFIAISPLA